MSDRNHLRPVQGDEGEELEVVQPAHEVARRLLVEAEGCIRGPDGLYIGAEPVLATIALGWATLALTEPRE